VLGVKLNELDVKLAKFGQTHSVISSVRVERVSDDAVSVIFAEGTLFARLGYRDGVGGRRETRRMSLHEIEADSSA
jgi:hypothetical protein